jgi:hypothetical protein
MVGDGRPTRSVNAGRGTAEQPGAPWWAFERPAAPRAPSSEPPAAGAPVDVPRPTLDQSPAAPPGPTARRGDDAGELTIVETTLPSARLPAIVGAVLLVAAFVWTQVGSIVPGQVLVPLAAVFLVSAVVRFDRHRHPDEPWLGRLLLVGVLAKLAGSWFRYQTFAVNYEGEGDATRYDDFGRRFAASWMGDGSAPDLDNLRETNFIHWFTGVVYYLFGSDFLTGFVSYGLLAFIGSYLWYRAAVGAVPFLDRRVFLALVVFAPSIVFWPASIGKEALMQLGIGAVALATAWLMRRKLVSGLALGAAGGWLLWVVRPHLLAMVVLAGGLAYIVGRVGGRQGGLGSLLSRPVGIIAVALLMAFSIGQGAEFLGIESLSLSSIEEELDEQTERSAQGGSQFDNGDNSLNPLNLPWKAVTVLLRPFPWEIDTNLQLLASLESALLAVFIALRLPSLRAALARCRTTPFLLYCWILTGLYAMTFSSFANFGLLVRQRSLVLPALFVLLSIDHRRVKAASVADAAAAEVAAIAARSRGDEPPARPVALTRAVR